MGRLKLKELTSDVVVEATIWFPVTPGGDSLFEREAKRREEEGLSKSSLLFPGTQLANPELESIAIGLPTSTGTARVLGGVKKKKGVFYKHERMTYVLGPASPRTLETMVEARALELTLKWTHREVFELVLQEWFGASATHNLANPSDRERILRSIIAESDLDSRDRTVPRKFKKKRTELKVRAFVSDSALKADPGKAPVLRIILTIAPQDPAAVERTSILLAASDWSSLSLEKIKSKASPASLHFDQRRRFQNILTIVSANLKMTVGEQIFDAIKGRHASRSDSEDLVKQLRADLDRHLIVSNHFGGARDTAKSSDPVERYQSRMSDLFGDLYQNHVLASPVAMLRRIFAGDVFLGVGLFNAPPIPQGSTKPFLGLGLFPEELGHRIWLQAGVGHCGEHAQTAFRVLRDIHTSGSTTAIRRATFSGNANIDHAFVLVNVEPLTVFLTRVLNSANHLQSVGEEINIIDLQTTLDVHDESVNGEALVLDAYLQFSAFGAKASKLLKSLQNKKDKRLNTTFVTFVDAFPTKPPTTDMTSRSDEELKGDFKNI